MFESTEYNELVESYIQQSTLNVRQEVDGEPPTIETVRIGYQSFEYDLWIAQQIAQMLHAIQTQHDLPKWMTARLEALSQFSLENNPREFREGYLDPFLCLNIDQDFPEPIALVHSAKHENPFITTITLIAAGLVVKVAAHIWVIRQMKRMRGQEAVITESAEILKTVRENIASGNSEMIEKVTPLAIAIVQTALAGYGADAKIDVEVPGGVKFGIKP